MPSAKALRSAGLSVLLAVMSSFHLTERRTNDCKLTSCRVAFWHLTHLRRALCRNDARRVVTQQSLLHDNGHKKSPASARFVSSRPTKAGKKASQASLLSCSRLCPA